MKNTGYFVFLVRQSLVSIAEYRAHLSILSVAFLIAASPAAWSSRKTAQANRASQAEPLMTIEDLKTGLKILEEGLELAGQQKKKEAIEVVQKWTPNDIYLKDYKGFWLALWSEDFEKIWEQYENLKKSKRFLRLRLALFREFLREENTFKSMRGLSAKQIQDEARTMLRQLRGTSEGELFESEYLRWLKRNKHYSEICRSERKRWLGEGENEFSVLIAGVAQCPMDFEDFLFRLRRLIFAARESQAEKEIGLFAKEANLPEWQKVYAESIFESNVGQPLKAFEKLKKYEAELLSSDFDINYFYIAQRAGLNLEAEEIIKKIIKRTPPGKMADIKFEQSFLFYQTGRYAEAHKIFDDLYKQTARTTNMKKKGRHLRTRNIRELEQLSWLRAWTLYLDGKYTDALEAFKQGESLTSDQARHSYWTGMTLIQLNQPTAAFLLFKKLAEPINQNRSFSYYNILGWLRTQELRGSVKNDEVIKNIITLTQSPRSEFPTPDENYTRSQMLEQYNQLSDESFSTDEGDIQVVNTENEVILSDDIAGIDVETDQDLKLQLEWVNFLYKENQSDLAKWHLYEIERRLNTRKKAEPIVSHYLDSKNYFRSLSLMQRVADIRQTPLSLKSDAIVWKSLYPEAFKEEVNQFANKRKIDPYFMWSIMRAETQYKSDAISPVGAIGLMQFMAYTMKRLGPLIDRDLVPSDLFVPKNSIEYGAAYLRKLSLELDFQAPLIAAAYNGGPHRVKLWVKNRGSVDYDVFVEHIPFAETRTYVKRVLSFRAMYDKIYNSKLDPVKLRYLIQKLNYKLPETFSLNEEWDPFKKEMQKTNK